jgi:hypothetical protein
MSAKASTSIDAGAYILDFLLQGRGNVWNATQFAG